MGYAEYSAWQTGEGAELMRSCGIREGMDVLDFGCSIGEYSIPLSVAVGKEGKVYAVDKSRGCVNVLTGICRDYNIDNITVIKSDEDKLDMGDAVLDAVLYFDLYHNKGKTVEERSEVNRARIEKITANLRSGGLLLVAVYSEMKLHWDFVNGPFTPKGAVKGQFFDTVEDGIKYFRMAETVSDCGFSLTKRVHGAVHFNEFCKRGEPDMDSFEREDVFVFTKE